MKNRIKQLLLATTAVSILALGLSGCGQSRSENHIEIEPVVKETEEKTVIVETEKETEKITEKQTEKETEKETEAAKLIQSVDYTSKDGNIKITLPDNSWKVTQDADELRVFSSGSAAMINIVHASTEAAMDSLSVFTSKDELENNLIRQYSDPTACEIESFEKTEANGINIYRYVVKYNATSRMWAYSVTYGIVAPNQAYVISGTVTDENPSLLQAVEKSVFGFRILKDPELKQVTGEVISGKTQKSTEAGTTSGTSKAELSTLNEYGFDTTLYSNDTANVRKEPGTDADIIDSVGKGDEIKVIGETKGWFKVLINGNEGYIRKDFLVYSLQEANQEQKPEDKNQSSASAEMNTQTSYGSAATLYAADTVNIRQEPGTDSAVIGGLTTGNSVSVIGETDNWFIVSVNGSIGYVSKAFLTYDSSVAEQHQNDENQGNEGDGGTTDPGQQNPGGGETGTSSPQSISGTIINFSNEYLTVQGDDGNMYNVYYGDAATSSVDGLYNGIGVGISLDSSQASSDGTLYATNVTGY